MRKQNIFTQVPVQNVKRNLFDLSHEVKMSGKFGVLYPILLMDCLPGDTIRDTMTAQVRLAPMLAPVMHRIDVKTDFFFVPTRLVTDHWEDFITGGQDGTAEPVLPYVTPKQLYISNGGPEWFSKGSLWDYFGLPVFEGVEPDLWSEEQVSALPFRAYMKIYNDFFRDPNLEDEKDLRLELQGDVSQPADGIADIMELMRRGWERDYFTSALPWAQRGAQVLLPIAGTGSVTYSPTSTVVDSLGNPPGVNNTLETNTFGDFRITGVGAGRVENINGVEITASSVTMNDFRRSLAIQRWMENNARGGARYIEQIQSHFNIRVPDYRLQRAEYLGGGRQPVIISEVVSTADAGDAPVGDLAGHGISVGKTNRFTYHCQEHGFVIGIMTVIPRTAYDQGIERLWTRSNKFDFAFPELAHLGEQEILSKELFYSFDAVDNNDNNEVFGYIPRYAEYKFKNDRVSGDFRDELNFWHLGRNLLLRPTLNKTFVTMYEEGVQEETYRRIFTDVTPTDYLWIQLFHNLTAKRPLPYFGVPQLNG